MRSNGLSAGRVVFVLSLCIMFAGSMVLATHRPSGYAGGAEALYKARDTSLGEPETASSSLLKACSLEVLNGLCTHFLSRGAMVPVHRHLNVTDLGGLGWKVSVMVPACLHASARDFPGGSLFRQLWPVHLQSGSRPTQIARDASRAVRQAARLHVNWPQVSEQTATGKDHDTSLPSEAPEVGDIQMPVYWKESGCTGHSAPRGCML